MARLKRSLRELKFAFDLEAYDMLRKLRALVRENALEEGFIYLQITRGAGERDFVIESGLSPTIVAFTQAKTLAHAPIVKTGIRVVTRPDLRWGRCDIKTTQLLYASLMKTEAVAAGADDVWLERDGFIGEGSSNNAYIVTSDGAIVTKPNSHEILPGITRAVLLTLCERDGIRLEERQFTIDEAKAAKEAFVTAASSWVIPVVEINGQKIGGGKPGPIAGALHELYVANARETAV